MKTNAKPSNGFLMYGNRLIEKDKPFALLGKTQQKLIANGADRKLFHRHYYFSEAQLIQYINSLNSKL